MPPHAGRLSLTLLVAGFLYVGPTNVLAQSSTVSCLSSFGWMNNSESQTPCLVGAYLQAACVGPFAVNPLPNGSHYIGPYADQQNGCQCSSVTYSAISACGICQGALIVSWDVWSANCTTSAPSVGVFPQGIPHGTAVPQWAFQDVTVSGGFNVTLAQATGDLPESFATTAQSTSTGATSTVLSASLTPIPSSTTTATNPTPTSSSSNTGAIAGGVVGGIVGILLIVGAAIFFFRRKKRSPISSLGGYTADSVSPPAVGPSDAPHFPTQTAQLRLYDPSDPSTFPPSSAAFSAASSGNMHSFTDPNQFPQVVQDSRLSLPQV